MRRMSTSSRISKAGPWIPRPSPFSDDASVIVGKSASSNGTEAFRWQDGLTVGLGNLGGEDFSSEARDVSADGSVVVGAATAPSNTFAIEAFRWTAEDAMVGIGDLGGGFFWSIAYGVSSDGAVVVGRGSRTSGFTAFRWTQEGGMTSLGSLSAGSETTAYAVSDDGRTVVGFNDSAAGDEAFVWQPSTGMRALQDWLAEEHGLELPGWQLRRAYDISGDGRVLVGDGTNPDGERQAWVVTLPEPVAVAASLVSLLCLARLRRARRRQLRGRSPSAGQAAALSSAVSMRSSTSPRIARDVAKLTRA